MREPVRIWIDTDCALGAPEGDVDDGYAIAAVARARQVELLGVSAVGGNTDAATAHACSADLMAVLGAAVPVVAARDAPAALAALPEGASLLAIGPLDNVLEAARRDPSFPARVSIHVVGTVRSRLRHPLLPLFDLNMRRHRRAFERLAFRRTTVCALDDCWRLRFGPGELEAIAATGPIGAYLVEHTRRWLPVARLRYQSRRFPVWDLVAALDLIGELGGELTRFEPTAATRRFVSSLRASGG